MTSPSGPPSSPSLPRFCSRVVAGTPTHPSDPTSRRPSPYSRLSTIIVCIGVFIFASLLVVDGPSSAKSQVQRHYPHLVRRFHAALNIEGLPRVSLAVRTGATNKVGPRIAIIGAGAGGSSTAFFLSYLASLNSSLATSITVFEKEHYIGGRSFPIRPWQHDAFAPAPSPEEEARDPSVECGAAIFVPANLNLIKAAKHFGLTTMPLQNEAGDIGFWDGSSFVMTESSTNETQNEISMLKRYGMAPLAVQSLMQANAQKIIDLYGPKFIQFGPYTSLDSLAQSGNLTSDINTVARKWLTSDGVDGLFIDEIISSSTQVNYGTPASRIHSLGAMISLSTGGAMSVKGGNRQIFQRFLEASRAEVRLGQEVQSIVEAPASEAGGSKGKWKVTTASSTEEFDSVILAAPFHQTAILSSLASRSIPAQEYVGVHVTFVVTSAPHPLPAAFSLDANSTVPTSIYSTFDTNSTKKPLFSSIDYLRPLSYATTASHFPSAAQKNLTLHVVKLFSPKQFTKAHCEKIFGARTIYKRATKYFHAYPKLLPVEDPEKDLAPNKLADGFWYVNGFERLVSTMETETVAGWNVASGVVQELFDYKAQSSWAEAK